MEKLKKDTEVLQTKQAVLESNIHINKANIISNGCHGRDLQFLIDRHEQYSRKNSIHIHDLKEGTNESTEQLTIQTLKTEIGIEIEESEIVHRTSYWS